MKTEKYLNLKNIHIIMAEKKAKIKIADKDETNPTVIKNDRVFSDEEILEYQQMIEKLKPEIDSLKDTLNELKEQETVIKNMQDLFTSLSTGIFKSFSEISNKIKSGEVPTEENLNELQEAIETLKKSSSELEKIKKKFK